MSDFIHGGDLLTEILARLPVASLLRFKSVCKPWYSLITSPSFVTKHIDQSIINSKRNGHKLLVRLYQNNDRKERYLLFNDDEKFGDESWEFEFPFKLSRGLFRFGYFKVVGSCNGLLCLADDYFSDKPQIIIWNPSTRKSVTLPMIRRLQCPHMFVYGFGAHPATREYKVIRIRYDMGQDHFHLHPEAEIYAQGTRSWKGISSAARPCCIVDYRWSHAFVAGAVHWVVYDPCVGGGFRNWIMSFNIASESFSEIMLPLTLVVQPPTSLSIKLFGESLAVICDVGRDGGDCCIWVMKEYGVVESWTELFSSNQLRGMVPIGFRKNDEVLLALAFLVDSLGSSLVSYAPGTMTFETTRIKGSLGAFYVDPFMETLVLV